MAKRWRVPHLIPLLGAVGVPIGLTFLGLTLGGALAIAPAVVAGGVLTLVLVALAMRHLTWLGGLADVVDGLSRRPVALPRAPALYGDVIGALERRDRRIRAERDDLGHRIRVLESMIDALPDPLITLDAGEHIVGVNRAARAAFEADPVGRDLAAVIRHPEILRAVAEVLAGGPARDVDYREEVPVARQIIARIAALPERDGDRGCLVLLQDLTPIRKVEEVRSEFVANVSHELRTPLATLLGLIETLQGAAKDDDAARTRFLAVMAAQGSRMSRLVDDLLSLSQIELNEHTPPAGEVDLAELLQGVKDTVAISAGELDIDIELEVAGLPPVPGDRDELFQVFLNLIVNAVKYGRAGKRVEVRGRLDDGHCAVAVQDFGAGIPRQEIPRLTERFYRVDKARSRELGGTGLGLAIVKHVVNRHRGSLRIESTEGRGSTFTVRLPVAPVIKL